MGASIRQVVRTVAAFALAVHTVIGGIAPAPADVPLDPFTIICHSETSAPTEQTPGPLLPTHVCDHCNLCSAATPPLTPDTVLAARFEPVRTLQVLSLVEFARHDNISADPKRARGPPALA